MNYFFDDVANEMQLREEQRPEVYERALEILNNRPPTPEFPDTKVTGPEAPSHMPQPGIFPKSTCSLVPKIVEPEVGDLSDGYFPETDFYTEAYIFNPDSPF